MSTIDELTNEASAMQKPVSDIAERGGSGAIAQLIQQYCPEGVEFRKVKDIYKRIKGTPITATKMKEIANPTGSVRIFAGGKTVIDANEEDIPNANITRVPAVLVQSRGVIDVVYYEQPFTFKNEMWAYTTENKTSVKYLYYVMKSNVQTFRDAASGMGALPQISLGTTEDFEIPLPPLPVQEAIVNILDRFAVYAAELQAELQARQQQYNYYRDTLLSFKSRDDVEWKKLGEVCKVYDGTHQTPAYKDSGIPFVSVENIGDIYNSKKYISQEDFDKYKIKPSVGDVFMTRIGSIGVCAVFDKPASIAYYVSLALLRPKQDVVLSRYLKHIIESRTGRKELRKRTLVNAVPIKVNKDDIGKIVIPIPPLSEQQRIVNILDRFDTLVNDLSQGLPAEIEARQQQYEYYRDKLLTFKRKEE